MKDIFGKDTLVLILFLVGLSLFMHGVVDDNGWLSLLGGGLLGIWHTIYKNLR